MDDMLNFKKEMANRRMLIEKQKNDSSVEVSCPVAITMQDKKAQQLKKASTEDQIKREIKNLKD